MEFFLILLYVEDDRIVLIGFPSLFLIGPTVLIITTFEDL